MVNWRSMWAKKFEKEDAKAEKAKKAAAEKAENELRRRQRARRTSWLKPTSRRLWEGWRV